MCLALYLCVHVLSCISSTSITIPLVTYPCHISFNCIDHHYQAGVFNQIYITDIYNWHDICHMYAS
jgi:hypothetical protein